MADKTVIVEIVYDTKQAIQNLNQLTSTIEGEKVAQAKLKDELEKGKISQNEYSKEVEKSKDTATKANAERKSTVQLLGAEKGSINEVRAEIKTLTSERNKLNLNTEEGRKRLKEINSQLDVHNKTIKDNVDATTKQKINIGNYKSALEGLPTPVSAVITGIGGMTKAALAFIATPIGAVIAAVGLALQALISYFKSSEEGQNRLNKITNIAKGIWEAFMNVVEKIGEIIYDAVSKPKETIVALGNLIKENLINRFLAFGVIGKSIVKILSGEFKEGFKELANGAIQMGTGVENSLDKMENAAISARDAIKNISKDVEGNVKKSIELSNIQASIDKKEREMLIDREKTRVQVAELILQSKRKDINSESERLAILQKASGLIDSLATREETLAAQRLKAAQLQVQISGDDKEALNAVAQAEADLISKKAEGLEARRRIEGQISELNIKAKEEIEGKKNAEIEANTAVVESDSAAQEEILRRRGEAIMALAELKAAELEKEAEGYEEQKEVQLERAEEELALKLEQEGLLQEEIELAEQEHKIRMSEIEATYQENIKAQREQALQQAYADMQNIINATQGFADKRVTILTGAFAKISTINYKEVKSSTDAFIAIGEAAKGLTDLIVAGHQTELANLETQKQSELALAGDNKEKQSAIEKKYANKAAELKHKQDKENKEKAIIDATIATLLGVVKALADPGGIAGIVLAALIGIAGAANIISIANQPLPTYQTYAKGGIIGGRSHTQGGTKFVGEDGSRFEAEKGEAMFVLKKDATAEIAALSALNESYGGRSWSAGKRRHLQDGGEVDTNTDVSRQVTETLQNTPIIVRVGDIETGMTNYNNVKEVGVI